MKPGELANVRLWLGADIQRESAELPLLTLSGHSVEYAVPAGGDRKPVFCVTYMAAGAKAYLLGFYPEAEKQWAAAVKEAQGFST